MKQILLTLAYDGGKFSGWQKQAKGVTVEGTLETALSQLFQKNISLLGSSRTDARVHAKAQKASFFTPELLIPLPRLPLAINRLLPTGVRVLNSVLVNTSFHPRYHACYRIYHYYFKEIHRLYPWETAYMHGIVHTPCLHRLNHLASAFLGKKDFTAFCSPKDEHAHKVRTIYFAQFFQFREHYVFVIQGNAFLWKMVRSIVGTLLFAERHRWTVEHLQTLLAAKERKSIKEVAPAHALCLEAVGYRPGDLLFVKGT